MYSPKGKKMNQFNDPLPALHSSTQLFKEHRSSILEAESTSCYSTRLEQWSKECKWKKVSNDAIILRMNDTIQMFQNELFEINDIIDKLQGTHLGIRKAYEVYINAGATKIQSFIRERAARKRIKIMIKEIAVRRIQHVYRRQKTIRICRNRRVKAASVRLRFR